MDTDTLFNQLIQAVNDVASTHHDWLQTLEGCLVNQDPLIQKDVKQTLHDNNIALDVASDDASSLQFLSGKLAKTISRLNPDQLPKAFGKVAHYLSATDDEFNLLQVISESENIPQTVQQKFKDADTARSALLQKVDELSAVISSATPQPCEDKFLEKMDNRTLEYTETQKLLQSKPDTDTLELASEGVGKLIDSWGDVVNKFVSDAETLAASSTSKFGSPSTIGDFFCIHGSLEKLYDRLTTNVDLKA